MINTEQNDKITQILSGIQPTNNLHVGNYFGSIEQWIKMQEIASSFLFIADLHAITVSYSKEQLKENILYLVATYLACGIDPAKSNIFVQSTIPEHTQLSWLFSCITPMGWLNRMTQFKDKAGKNKDQASLGLYSYPVLMSADILLYKPSHVPVGDDQKQHIELARDIAGAFNRFVDKDYFITPSPMITGEATRIMSLKDGTKKMSKSDPSDFAKINLTDSNDIITQKIKKAKTDEYLISHENIDSRVELKNLAVLFASCTDDSYKNIIARYEGQGFQQFKYDLAEVIINKFSPIKIKIDQYLNDKNYLLSIINQGTLNARSIAEKTLKDVKDLMGFRI